MKASSLVFSLVLGIAASTLTNSLPENLTFNSRKILAQDQAPSCPLPPDLAITFRNSECQAVREHLTFVTPKSGFYVKLF